MRNINQDTRFLIVGLGLIGGSYAKALSSKGYTVKAITKEKKDIEFAIEKGYICGGSDQVEPELIRWADIIVLGLYPHTLIDWVNEYAHNFRAGQLITDVTGVKGIIVNAVQKVLPEGVEFIAAHPMAGREKSGVQNSDDAVFRGANYIVVPTEKNTQKAIDTCKELGELLGFFRISELDVATHDQMVAFLSQLTHCIAVSLMCANEQQGLEAYTGDSFRDLTRIARINDEMWSELFLSNREALLMEIDNFSMQLSHLRRALYYSDRDELRNLMRLSTQRREKFDKPRVDQD